MKPHLNGKPVFQITSSYNINEFMNSIMTLLHCEVIRKKKKYLKKCMPVHKHTLNYRVGYPWLQTHMRLFPSAVAHLA